MLPKPLRTGSVSDRVEILSAEAIAIRHLGADVVTATDLGTHALNWALHGVPVFFLRGKHPAVRNPHPEGSWERLHCKGECGQLGHGVHDATTDPVAIIAWSSTWAAGMNIGGRVPDGVVVIDVDPRHGGDITLGKLEAEHGKLPETQMTISGRGDGGCHYWFQRPPGKLSSARLGKGIDIKTSTGYVVLPPSIHPETGKPYRRVDGPIGVPPAWLVDLMRRPEPEPATAPRPVHRRFTGRSLAEEFNARTTWSDILTPYGWTLVCGDGDSDGSRWRHPAATATSSASIRGARLYVYSPNTQFEVTEASDPNGYSKFHAHAVLNHNNDMSAAARHLTGKA